MIILGLNAYHPDASVALMRSRGSEKLLCESWIVDRKKELSYA